MRTAWVLPGGSTFGAAQAGIATALLESDLAPDLLVGTSAGSLNAAWLAYDPTPGGAEALRQLWISTRRTDVFPMQFFRYLAGKLGLSNHLMNSHGLARWLHQVLPYRRIEDARIPLSVTATDIQTGDAVYFERGPLLPALVASCALPGVFPPVRVGGRWLLDGGAAALMPVSRAVRLGAERVFVVPCGGTEPFEFTQRKRGIGALATLPAPKVPPRSISGVNGAALGAAMAAASRADLELNAERCELYVVPAPSIDNLSPYSFEHAQALIDAAWRIARDWIPTARPVSAGPVDMSGAPVEPDRTAEPASKLGSSGPSSS